MTVLAAGTWATNGDLIADVASLGYLRSEWVTWDGTYGLGNFWTRWKPDIFWRTDIDPAKSPSLNTSLDARSTPWGEATFDAIVCDPPYKLNGTGNRGGPADSDESYGVDGAYVPWQERHRLIREMMDEAARVLKPRGMFLLKCQDQVCSGKVRWQTDEFTEHARTLGLVKVDSFNFPGMREQPSGRSQKHARRNYSSLLVFQGKRGREHPPIFPLRQEPIDIEPTPPTIEDAPAQLPPGGKRRWLRNRLLDAQVFDENEWADCPNCKGSGTVGGTTMQANDLSGPCPMCCESVRLDGSNADELSRPGDLAFGCRPGKVWVGR